MTDNRAQLVNVKVPTDFGSIHFSIRHDEQNRVTAIYWTTHDSDLTPETQIGKLLGQCADGINKAITAMNEDWSGKWNLAELAEIARRQAAQ